MNYNSYVWCGHDFYFFLIIELVQSVMQRNSNRMSDNIYIYIPAIYPSLTDCHVAPGERGEEAGYHVCYLSIYSFSFTLDAYKFVSTTASQFTICNSNNKLNKPPYILQNIILNLISPVKGK
jgi:hypothetical protein